MSQIKKVTPFLLFDGQAEEAARFYVSLLPESQIDRMTHWPEENPGGSDNDVLTVEFTLGGMQFVAEVDRLWAALSAGGSEGPCGWLKDRWGVSWQISPSRLPELLTDPDPKRARRAMDAMMKMSRINIAEVERAADGA